MDGGGEDSVAYILLYRYVLARDNDATLTYLVHCDLDLIVVSCTACIQ